MDLLWRLALKVAYRAAQCYWFVFRPETRGVYVAVWCGSQILLIRNSYKAKQTFPAGGVKRRECDEDAALRELSEEVGLRLGHKELCFYDRFESRDEYKIDRSVVFEVHLQQLPTLKIDHREVVHAEFVESQEACQRDLVPVVQQYLEHLRSAPNP